MPVYNTQSPPPFLGRDYPLNTSLVFSAEALVTGEFSQQLQVPTGLAQKGIRVELDFSADPGAYEIDVMEADTDQSGAAEYQQVPVGGAMSTRTAGPNGANTHQSSDQIPVAGQFVCLYVKAQPANPCTCTARITRAA
jgi:hypothetical protein